MSTLADARFTHNYNCYYRDFIEWLLFITNTSKFPCNRSQIYTTIFTSKTCRILGMPIIEAASAIITRELSSCYIITTLQRGYL